MRVAVISDTHMPRGTRALPPRCAELCREADAILHAGDFTRVAAYEEIAALGPPLHAVRGNVDEAALAWGLPERLVVELGGVRIGMIHMPGPAAGRLLSLRSAFPDADVAVFGHTHMPEHGHVDGFEIFNPGSPTERRRAPVHTMGLAHVEDGRVRFEIVDLT